MTATASHPIVRTVLFDLDGTLTDSLPGIGATLAHALATVGRPAPTAQQLHSFAGPPLIEGFLSLGLDRPTAERAAAAYRERYDRIGLFENEVFDGVEDMLVALAADGRTLAVATSKREPIAQRIVGHFGLDRWIVTVSGEDRAAGRVSKADSIAEALARTGADPAATVMVGDRVHDLVGAAAHGVRAIGVRWGYAPDGELDTAPAWAIVDRPADIIGIVRADGSPFEPGTPPTAR